MQNLNLKSCPYAEKCYRRNPIHFGEFSHPHCKIFIINVFAFHFCLIFILVDRIYENGLDKQTNSYSIPPELLENSELILQQLKLLEKLFPKTKAIKKKEENPVLISDNNSTFLPEKCSKIPSSGASTSATAACPKPSSESNVSKKQKMMHNIKDYIPVIVEKGQMAKKLEAAAPYNVFLTAITDSKLTHHEPLSVTFQGLLSCR